MVAMLLWMEQSQKHLQLVEVQKLMLLQTCFEEQRQLVQNQAY
jgi:hypothetical protein